MNSSALINNLYMFLNLFELLRWFSDKQLYLPFSPLFFFQISVKHTLKYLLIFSQFYSRDFCKQAIHTLWLRKNFFISLRPSNRLLPRQKIVLELEPVLRIQIHRIHMFLGLPDPDPLVRGMDPDPALDPDPSIIMQK
jgi:hypothetical protein